MKPQARRKLHNSAIAAAVLLLGAILYALAPDAGRLMELSVTTGYLGLILIGSTLCIGPLNVLRSRPNPVSTHLRRDLGIWAGLLTTLHVVIGLQRHLDGRFALYFLSLRPDGLPPVLPRMDLFGAANWVGLVATLVCLTLLALSNDRSLRRLGSGHWKAIQRWNYALFPLSLLHGVMYQVYESRALAWIAAGLLVGGVAAALQSFGYRRHPGHRTRMSREATLDG